ncbi:MAG TPA: hypothetical protein VK791_09030 [bacterium]|jgi:hypothetical protein|nr:hypothetical protein [bacterium]
MKANEFKNLFQRNWVAGLACCLLGLVGILLVSCTANVNPASFPKVNGETNVNPGDIAFTGVIYNGNSEFSFVPTTNIAAGVTIFFTNYSYDPTNSSSPLGGSLVDESTTIYPSSNYPGIGTVTWSTVVNGNSTGITEGTVAYTVGSSGLAAYSQVIIGNTSNSSNQLQFGTVTLVSGGAAGSNWLLLNHNGAGHKILAYTLNGSNFNYVAAVIFGPDTWQTSGSIGAGAFWDSYLPASLSTQNSTDLSALWNGTQAGNQDGNMAQFNVNGTGSNQNGQNQNAVLNSCQNTLAGIVNPLNWQADGNDSKSKVSLNPVIGLSVCSNAGYTGLIP